MTEYYPYSEEPISEVHIHFPKTPHSDLLTNDEEHSIRATFFREAANYDPSRVQLKLTQFYGGALSDYPILQCTARDSRIRLPEFLDRDQVIEELMLWAVDNRVTIWAPDDDEWTISPTPFRINLRIRKFPFLFWHLFYFRYLTSSFGSTIFIDAQNTLGTDRSTLRLTILCYDPSRIPKSIIIDHENRWTKCYVEMTRWAFLGDLPPDGYQGSLSDGQNDDEGGIPLHPQTARQRDTSIRQSLANAQEQIGTRTTNGRGVQYQRDGNFSHPSHRSIRRSNVPSPPGSGLKQFLNPICEGVCVGRPLNVDMAKIHTMPFRVTGKPTLLVRRVYQWVSMRLKGFIQIMKPQKIKEIGIKGIMLLTSQP